MNSISDHKIRKKCLLFTVGILLFGQLVWAMEVIEHKGVWHNGQQQDIKLSEKRKKTKEKAILNASKLIGKYRKGYDKRKKYAEEEKEFLANQKERSEEIYKSDIYLKLGTDRQKIILKGLEMSLWLKELLDSLTSAPLKKEIFNVEKNEVIIDLDKPLKNVTWLQSLKPGCLKNFVRLCEYEDTKVKKIVKKLKTQEELIPLVLIAEFLQATKRPDANHNPDRDVLALLSKELKRRIIKDKNFLELPKKKKALLWQIMDNLPDTGLGSLKEIVFPDQRYAEPTKLEGHTSEVQNAVFLPNGKLLTASINGEFLTWDLNSTESKPFLKGEHPPYDMLLLPRGELVVNPGDCDILVMDPTKKRNRSILRLKGHTELINSLALRGQKLASASDDRTVRIWNLKIGGKEKVLRGHEDSVQSLLWLSDNMLVSGDSSGKIYLWNLRAGEKRVLEGHTDQISSLLPLAGRKFASSSWDGTIRIWNPNKKEAESILAGHNGRIENLVSLPNDKIASFSKDIGDRTIRIWNPNKKKVEKVLEGHTEGVNFVLRILNDKLASASNKEIIVWNLDQDKPKRVLKKEGFEFSPFLYFLPDGRLFTNSSGGTFFIWNVLDIFGGLTFRQSILARLLQINSILPKDKKVSVFSDKRLQELSNELPETSKHLFARLGWFTQ